MAYRPHINKARAAACVHGPDIIEALVHAEYQKPGTDVCAGYLEDALHDAKQVVANIEAALKVELEAIEAAKASRKAAPRGVPNEYELATARMLGFVIGDRK